MVLGVARQSGGTVQITPRSVEGTSIEVYLPRADSRVPSDEAASPSTVSDHVEFLVDDGIDVRAIARRRPRRSEPHRRQTLSA